MPSPVALRRAAFALLTASILALLSVGSRPDRAAAQRRSPSATTATLPIAVFFVGPESRPRWDAYAVATAGAAPVRLGFTVDAGGFGATFHGTDAPALSADHRWLAYSGAGRLRVRDLRDGTERVVPTTLDRARSSLLVDFAADSSALLFFDRSRMSDVDADSDEGGMGEILGEHRIFVLATGEVRAIPLDEESETPALLENANDLLVATIVRSTAARTSALVRVHVGGPSATRTTIATSPGPSDFGQLVAAHGQLAWLTSNGIAVADHDAHDIHPLTSAGSFAEYQWPVFGPTTGSMTYQHMRRTPRRGGGFDMNAVVTTVDRTTSATTERYPCTGPCSAGYESESTLLVLDRDRLVRVGADGRARRVRSSVRAIAFAGAKP